MKLVSSIPDYFGNKYGSAYNDFLRTEAIKLNPGQILNQDGCQYMDYRVLHPNGLNQYVSFIKTPTFSNKYILSLVYCLRVASYSEEYVKLPFSYFANDKDKDATDLLNIITNMYKVGLLDIWKYEHNFLIKLKYHNFTGDKIHLSKNGFPIIKKIYSTKVKMETKKLRRDIHAIFEKLVFTNYKAKGKGAI